MFPHAPPQPNIINTPLGDAAACPTAPLPKIIICAASPPLFLSRPQPAHHNLLMPTPCPSPT